MRYVGLDLNLLVALDALLDTRSVTETARRLNLSQPSASAALARLREYFEDELLTQVGRKMLPTAKAQDLAPAIKEMLNLVRFRITHADEFDPTTSQRRFSVLASDYAFDVVLSKVVARAERVAPQVSFDISPTGPEGMRHFLNGDVDVLITVANYILTDHPQMPLFSDDDCVVCWNEGKFAAGIDATQFLGASHAIAVFGEERRPTVSELHFDSSGIQRHVSVRVSSFSALPATVVGTDRVAIMHRHHAQLFSKLYPISYHNLPVTGPGISQVAQWHRFRAQDKGVRWLVAMLVEQSASLRTGPDARPGK